MMSCFDGDDLMGDDLFAGQPHVVHVSPLSFGQKGLIGGGERYVRELALAMSERSPTTLLTFGDRRSVGKSGRLRVVTLKRRGNYRGSEVNPLSEALPLALASADIIHVHQWESIVTNSALILGKILNRPVF